MAQISRETLKAKISAILKGADLETLSAKKVRQQLEQELGVDLSDRKKEIDAIIMADVEDQVNSHSEEEEVSEEETTKGKDESESEPEPDVSDKAGDDDDYEPGAKKPRKPKASPKKRRASDDDDSDEEWGKRKRQSPAKKGGGGGGRGKKSAFTKSFKLSPELADVVGADVMPRHEVVKKLWAVIKERELQDPKNKQYAICDDQLLKVFGVKRFRTFGMMKHLKEHFLEAA
ncbi:upstream activation factor subunit spp27-like isoform X2 [Penaeus chinensis]|uniref:upstream activation factor subunit spp27-like isoform X2 n=1 Tax=Penaeus chinensis TaxID=139456 RepID=UPI001FB76787|nr:upstream activation factor subunit spp27-like isoform X2 [Penaeus chinensis]